MGVKATESGFNQTVQKDQATLIAELISRVTSLEDTVEFILEHSPITEQTKVSEVYGSAEAVKVPKSPAGQWTNDDTFTIIKTAGEPKW